MAHCTKSALWSGCWLLAKPHTICPAALTSIIDAALHISTTCSKLSQVELNKLSDSVCQPCCPHKHRAHHSNCALQACGSPGTISQQSIEPNNKSFMHETLHCGQSTSSKLANSYSLKATEVNIHMIDNTHGRCHSLCIMYVFKKNSPGTGQSGW